MNHVQKPCEKETYKEMYSYNKETRFLPDDNEIMYCILEFFKYIEIYIYIIFIMYFTIT